MCRIYAHISKTPKNASDLLAESERSLLAQSKVRGREQKDGWGIGYYSERLRAIPLSHGSRKRDQLRLEGRGARVLKSPNPLLEEETRFQRAAGRIHAPILIAHIRAASNPRKLPKRRLIGLVNTQPYRHQHLLFAHNGTVEIPDAVTRKLGPLRKHLRGLNDSEVYFWQFMKFYRQTCDVARSLEACVRELRELGRVQHRAHGERFPYRGLNTVVSDGRRLYVLCHYPSRSKALLSDRPLGRMVLGRREGRTVVASEPLDKGPWSDINEGELLVIDAAGKVRRRMLRI